MNQILIVEDEKKVSALIQKSLDQENYGTQVAFNGVEALEIISKKKIDLIILDILMPEKNGFEVLKEIRDKGNHTPVLFLSAKGSTDNRIEGLNLGADDFLPKPFSISELLARVKALIRRSGMEKKVKLSVSDLFIDLETRSVKRGDRKIELTTKEFMILEYFIKNKNKVLTRSNICEHIWNYNFDTGTNLVDVYVSHLREKIDKKGEDKLFHTLRGVGYILKSE